MQKRLKGMNPEFLYQKMISFKTKYQIGDYIYHRTPESEKGLIIDISYSVRKQEINYLVAIGFNNEVWCLEGEIQSEKQVI